MLVVVQRVSEAKVSVEGRAAAAVGPGLLILLGVAAGDGERDAAYLAAKIAHLRLFADDESRMNRSLLDVGGEALVVSQFTLHGDCRKGRRPDFTRAAPPAEAERLYDRFIEELSALGVPTRAGEFGAMMAVSLTNDGPVTLIVRSPSEAG
ncbi:MAG TPA: D-aminoacyl-tRNA deacylase [bacterium]|nr:D-aminoacyl-tRNA deacylase [bacterium]